MQDQLSMAIAQCPANISGAQDRLGWLSGILAEHADEPLDLLLLPELFQCGYHIGEAVKNIAEPSDGPFYKSIADLAKLYNCAIIYGYAESDEGILYNSAQCVSKSGERIGHHRKLILPPGFEGDHFVAGTGCELFTLGAFKIAILICYDVEFPENVRHVSLAGADLVVVPTALAAQWGVVAEKLVPTRAFENGVFVSYANYSGQENELYFYGGSCIVSPCGETLARANKGECLLKAKLNLNEVTAAQSRLPYHTDRLSLPWC